MRTVATLLSIKALAWKRLCTMDGTGFQYEALSIRLRKTIDSLCTQFETAFKSGHQPQIEKYLEQLDEPYRAALLRELFVLELHYCQNKVDRSDYVRRFPAYADVIIRMMDDHSNQSANSRVLESTGEWRQDECDVDTGVEIGYELRATNDLLGKGMTLNDEPSWIGRYQILGVLGRGGFGTVYRAFDGRLKRTVAVKLPHASSRSSSLPTRADLDEAQMLASLDHSNIVPIYDVQKSHDGRYYVVSKLIEGSDLRALLNQDHPSFDRSVEIVATIADALHYAHSRGLIHRDIKPANILIDRSGNSFVADFGLALREKEIRRQGEIAGTPSYMSPEQARGENHLVDGRSDIFSLGVVMYQLVTRQLPFVASGSQGSLSAIINGKFTPPRQLNDRIPRELDRICLKAMASRAADRYPTASELADDLRDYQKSSAQSGEGAPAELKVVPRGLQAYNRDDADFFWHLLPGPHDRHRVPYNIRILKSQLEELESDNTFRVGIVYGPSGCGKSSLVKAGLLPHLNELVVSVYVEATEDRTEGDLLTCLKRRVPRADEDMELSTLLSAVRQSKLLPAGQKLVIVIDQFEQWLNARSPEGAVPLVHALRQCDGGRVQCVLLIRDDFWMPASRFMNELDEPIVEHKNAIAVDLFEKDHAATVLAILGHAFGKLPSDLAAASRSQRAFLRESVTALASSGRVIPIRLAIFAEMMKHEAWTPQSLRRIGGMQGVGVTFLNATFVHDVAPHEHRRHEKAARAVLERLLPRAGQSIKGGVCSRDQLLEASGYSDRGKSFDELLRILTRETRLLSEIQVEEAPYENGTESRLDAIAAYQLTHDYLVPSIRDWLHQDRRTSRRGRAELRLIERAELWEISQRKRKQLPTLLEWLNIEFLTKRSRWTQLQRDMMRTSRAVHTTRLAIILAGLTVVSTLTYEFNRKLRASMLVDALRTAETREIEPLLKDILSNDARAKPLLEQWVATAESPEQSLHARLALMHRDPTQTAAIMPLVVDSEHVDLEAFLSVRRALLGTRTAQPLAAEIVRDKKRFPHERFRAACLVPHGKDWSPEARPVICRELLLACSEYPHLAGTLVDLFRDNSPHLDPELVKQFGKDSSLATQAARVLAAYCHEAPARLIQLLLEAKPDQLPFLLKPIQTLHASFAREVLVAKLDQVQETASSENSIHGRQIANMVICLFELGVTDRIWNVLGQQLDPSARHFVIRTLGPAEIDPWPFVERLRVEQRPTVISAILLSLGGYSDRSKSDQRVRSSVVETVRHFASKGADPGVHGAADWLLRKWGEPTLHTPQYDLANPSANHWIISPTGQVMVVLPKPSDSESLRHGFAIGMYEVTNAQFDAFYDEFHGKSRLPDPNDTNHADGPTTRVSWYQAAAYCNWLSRHEGLDECYRRLKSSIWAPRDDCLSRSGYRLPTVDEWEYACSSNASTKWFFGRTGDLYDDYGWFALNTRDLKKRSVGQKRPNGFGLFDTYGNVTEWCHTREPNRPNYIICGGAAGDAVKSWTSNREAGPPNREDLPAVGFRLARSWFFADVDQ